MSINQDLHNGTNSSGYVSNNDQIAKFYGSKVTGISGALQTQAIITCISTTSSLILKFMIRVYLWVRIAYAKWESYRKVSL